ncbi:MAG: hypothetical protein CL740_01155 [Chloroflexi bacterium]|nr:hypothetical protein [Chloroflexota bacterium]|tara:strand:+ start:10542 stop:11405 length:864 start_codon:yes stop_codon:yes gene_type:complete
MSSSIKWDFLDTILAIILSTLLVILGSIFFEILFELKFPENIKIKNHIYFLVLISTLIILIIKKFSLPYKTLFTWLFAWAILSFIFINLSEKNNNNIYFYNFSLEIICSSLLTILFLLPAINLSIIKYKKNFYSLGFQKTKIKYFSMGIYYWIACLIIVGLWGWMLEILKLDFLLPPNTAKEVLNLAFENIFITIILVSMIVPICEEVFFRGFLINGLERKFNLKISLLISSGIFSIFHIHIGSLFPTFILGICLGLLYIKSKSIYPSIFIHSIHNFLAVIISKYYL